MQKRTRALELIVLDVIDVMDVIGIGTRARKKVLGCRSNPPVREVRKRIHRTHTRKSESCA